MKPRILLVGSGAGCALLAAAFLKAGMSVAVVETASPRITARAPISEVPIQSFLATHKLLPDNLPILPTVTPPVHFQAEAPPAIRLLPRWIDQWDYGPVPSFQPFFDASPDEFGVHLKKMKANKCFRLGCTDSPTGTIGDIKSLMYGEPCCEFHRQLYTVDVRRPHRWWMMQFQHCFGYETPMAFCHWQWSDTFHRWGAFVIFYDGWQGYTWPKDF